MKLDKLGWVTAAGLAGAMFVAGFQGNQPKFANVDLEKVFQESDAYKQGNIQLQSYAQPRIEVLQFVKNNSAMKPSDAQDYVAIAVQPNGDTAKMSKISNDAQAAQSAFNA